MVPASRAEVVTWFGAIAERLRSTPAATLNTDDITESTTRTHTKTNPSSCGRVSLAIIFMEISLRRPNPVALTTWPEPSCSRVKKELCSSSVAPKRPSCLRSEPPPLYKSGLLYCGGVSPGPVSGAVLGPEGAGGALCSGGACSDDAGDDSGGRSFFHLHLSFSAFHSHSVLAVQSASLSPLQIFFDASSHALKRRTEKAAATTRVNIGTFL